MCGIVGYVGPQQAEGVVIEGLRRLEYRGYDSAGIALVHEGKIASEKRAGKLANLDKALADHPLPEACTGIGHTRWATHGAPNDRNAHPHLGAAGRVALVVVHPLEVVEVDQDQRVGLARGCGPVERRVEGAPVAHAG